METGTIETNFPSVIDLIKEQQEEYALSRLENLPESYIVELFSKWAEDNRYIPEGISDFPGPFDPSFCPPGS